MYKEGTKIEEKAIAQSEKFSKMIPPVYQWYVQANFLKTFSGDSFRTRKLEYESNFDCDPLAERNPNPLRNVLGVSKMCHRQWYGI